MLDLPPCWASTENLPTTATPPEDSTSRPPPKNAQETPRRHQRDSPKRHPGRSREQSGSESAKREEGLKERRQQGSRERGVSRERGKTGEVVSTHPKLPWALCHAGPDHQVSKHVAALLGIFEVKVSITGSKEDQKGFVVKKLIQDT